MKIVTYEIYIFNKLIIKISVYKNNYSIMIKKKDKINK